MPKAAEGQEMASKEGCLRKDHPPPKPSLFYRWASCTETMQEEGEASVAETHRVLFESTSSEIFIP